MKKIHHLLLYPPANLSIVFKSVSRLLKTGIVPKSHEDTKPH